MFTQIFNAKVEDCFEKLGQRISKHAITVLFVVCAACSLLAIGLTTVETDADASISELWIEADSRIHKETKFIESQYPTYNDRTEMVLAKLRTPLTASGNDQTAQQTFATWFNISKMLTNNVTVTVDLGGTQTKFVWKDVCARPGAPVGTGVVMDWAGIEYGLPCTKFNPLDCYREGQFDFKFPNPLVPCMDDPTGDLGIDCSLVAVFLNVSCSEDLAAALRGQTIIPVPDGLPEILPFSEVCPVYCKSCRGAYLDLEDLGLPDAYSHKPSFETTSAAEMYKHASQGGCTMWAGANVPTNLMYGVPSNGQVHAFAMVMEVISAELLAERLRSRNGQTYYQCTRQCVNKKCRRSFVLCGAGCFSSEQTCLQAKRCETLPPAAAAQCKESCNLLKTDCELTCLTKTAADCEQACFVECGNEVPPTKQELAVAEEVLLAWEQQWLWALGNTTEKDMEVEYLATRTLTDLVSSATATDQSLLFWGYFAMVAYGCVSLVRADWLRSRAVLGVAGVLLVILGVAAALGLCALCGVKFTPVVIQVLPFLALGLGVDDMFVLAYGFSCHTIRGAPSVHRTTGRCLREAGASTSLTSLVNCIAFLIASQNPLPAVSSFSLAALVVVAVNYLVVLFGFSSLLALDGRRQAAQRRDCCCCLPVPTTSQEKLVSANSSQSHLPDLIRPESGDSIDSAGSSSSSSSRQEEEGSSERCQPREAFAACVVRVPPYLALFVGAVVLGIAAYGATLTEVGLPLSDIVPSDHYSSQFLSTRSQYFHTGALNLFVGMDSEGKAQHVDWPSKLPLLLDLERELGQAPGIDKQTPPETVSWLDKFCIFVNNTFPESVSDTYYPPLDVYLPANNITVFHSLLTHWRNTEGIPYGPFLAMGGPAKAALLSYRVPAVTVDMDEKNTGFILEHLRATRKIADKYRDENGVPAFVHSFEFSLYEQYMNVQRHLGVSLALVAAGLALSSFTFLLSFRAVAIAVFVIAVIVFEVYGFMGYWGLKVNGVCVVNLVMAVGVCVEFTAHIVRVFMITPGSREVRTAAAVRTMAMPVLSGTISTFLGILPMAFATFPYFRLYFFNQYLLILLCGFGNGLFLLPSLLRLVGPPSLSKPQFRGESGSFVIELHDVDTPRQSASMD